MHTAALTRRRLLLSTTLAASLAGCSGTSGDDPGDSDEPTGTDGSGGSEGPSGDANSTDATTEQAGSDEGSDDPSASTGTPGETTDATATDTPGPDSSSSGTGDTDTASTDDDLDLREANVVGVSLSPSGGSYRFDVTLYHDDDGEDGYANWWQVETLDGEQLGRRTLLHAHSTAPFTRSETISVPDGTTHVVVRGHDQTHGYGGQAMVVNVDTGETQAVRQGPEPRDFSTFEPTV
ncbi:hypothetical protein [Salinigranum salinum]|uniref:hypothetical protein n=1 Tax=Salinigranum salinum TaxID=1364937 RepID=UPI001260C4A6|nr:hypothetical protein [Salinigranum salinum]